MKSMSAAAAPISRYTGVRAVGPIFPEKHLPSPLLGFLNAGEIQDSSCSAGINLPIGMASSLPAPRDNLPGRAGSFSAVSMTIQ
jgi:hypothetical protein